MTTSTPSPLIESPGWADRLTPAAMVRGSIVVVLFILTYWTIMKGELAGRWTNDPAWSHAWLIPLFSGYCLYVERVRLFRAKPKINYLGAVILIGSLATMVISAFWLRMGYPRAISIVGTIFGLTLLFGGWSIMRVAWFPILFLILAVPLPQKLYAELTRPLRELATIVATAVMPLFAPGLYLESQAVVIDYMMPGREAGKLNVDEACSGMRTLMGFVTLGFVMAYLVKRPAWQRVMLIASCLPIALLCNSIRVTVTGLLHVYGHADWARGTPHTMLGIVLFMLALGVFMLIGYVLEHLFVEVPAEDEAEEASA